MPIWRTTHNIFKAPWEGDYFDPNWMNHSTIQTPPKKDWDYKREMQIEDVNLWEVLMEGGAFTGVYAAWDPYAEFYLVLNGCCQEPVTFYGKGAQKKLKKYLKSIGIKLHEENIWVEPDEMWLYT